MFRIPRHYALQVAPVALIIILLPLSGFLQNHRNSLSLNFAVQLGMLSAWLWLQWPRKKLAYVAVLFGLLVYCFVPAMMLTLNYIERGDFQWGAPLCDCWIAALVSTSIAIAARLVLPWRLVDAQSNDDAANDTNARGSIFDLIVAVSACAGAFALIQYRLEGDFFILALTQFNPRPWRRHRHCQRSHSCDSSHHTSLACKSLSSCWLRRWLLVPHGLC